MADLQFICVATAVEKFEYCVERVFCENEDLDCAQKLQSIGFNRRVLPSAENAVLQRIEDECSVVELLKFSE